MEDRVITVVMFIVFVFACGYVLGALFGLPQVRRRRSALPIIEYQPTDHERRQFANYLDVPAVRRRQQIPTVRE